MRKDELNIIDRFLYKLFIGVFLLLFILFLGKLEVVNINKVQSKMTEHANILKIIKGLNGKNNFLFPIDINDQVTSINDIYVNAKPFYDGYRIEVNEFQGVEAYKSGVVVEIKRNNDKTYYLKIKGLDNNEYIYDKLASISCNIYKIIQSGEVIGTPYYDGNNYFNFYILNNDQPVSLLS